MLKHAILEIISDLETQLSNTDPTNSPPHASENYISSSVDALCKIIDLISTEPSENKTTEPTKSREKGELLKHKLNSFSALMHDYLLLPHINSPLNSTTIVETRFLAELMIINEEQFAHTDQALSALKDTNLRLKKFIQDELRENYFVNINHHVRNRPW
jgi:hypothetical protein